VTSGAVPSRRFLGYLEAVAAAGLWGSSGVFAVHLFRLGVPPESVALLRPVVGVLFLLVGLALTHPDTLRVDLRGFAFLCLGGGTAVGIFQVAYQMSTDAVGVPRTVALLYLAPALVAAVSGPLLGEWPTPRRLRLVALTLGGVWLTVAGAEDIQATFGSRGLGWGMLAGASYATYTIFGRVAAPRFGSARTVFYSTLGACLLLAVVLPVTSGPPVMPDGARAWAVLIAFGGLTIAAAQFLFFDALGRIDAGGASVGAAIEPAVAALLATVLLSQGLAPIGWLGVTMIAAGVVGVGLGAHR
jgi:DME family drug/metabolite transporter